MYGKWEGWSIRGGKGGQVAEREVYQNERDAVARLRNNGVSVDEGAKVIIVTVAGIKLWGAIDYLQRFHKYSWGKR
jgi:hypothetical protein